MTAVNSAAALLAGRRVAGMPPLALFTSVLFSFFFCVCLHGVVCCCALDFYRLLKASLLLPGLHKCINHVLRCRCVCRHCTVRAPGPFASNLNAGMGASSIRSATAERGKSGKSHLLAYFRSYDTKSHLFALSMSLDV